MAIKDITAARKFYEYAANAGSAHAATALAWTFDADFAAELGVLGLKPDPVMAATWYRRAAELGNPGAAARLRSLLNSEAAAR
jgi:TPR repeat protein